MGRELGGGPPRAERQREDRGSKMELQTDRKSGEEEERKRDRSQEGRAMRDSQAARQPGRRRPREEKEGGSGVGERDGEMRARHRETDGQRGPDNQAWKVDGVRAQNPLAQGPGQRDQRSQVWGAPGTVLSSPGASPPPRNSRYAPGSCRSPGAGLDPADRGQSLSWGPASQWER